MQWTRQLSHPGPQRSPGWMLPRTTPCGDMSPHGDAIPNQKPCFTDSWEENQQPILLPFGVRLFATPWTAARQASLSFTTSWSLLKPMSVESVMPSNQYKILKVLKGPSILLTEGYSVLDSFRDF